MAIISIHGDINSGKNELGDILAELHRKNNKVLHKKAFADKLKESLAITWNIPREKFEDRKFKKSISPTGLTWRDLMRDYGESMRKIDIDYWYNALMSQYNKQQDWVITDLRHLNEPENLKRDFNVFLVKIKRPHTEKSQHISDNDLNNYKNFDFYLDNSGDLRNLQEKAEILYGAWLDYIENKGRYYFTHTNTTLDLDERVFAPYTRF